ncbi:hypothetical protein SKC41_27625 [Mycobacterium sp. 050128]|uniref:hypothetical protein n=1 Tax=Mycobacterium sp. 050128 TaxID=3096112 RepID=UPI002EDB7CFE
MDAIHRSDDDSDNLNALDFGEESGYEGGAVLDYGDETGRGMHDALDFGEESGYESGGVLGTGDKSGRDPGEQPTMVARYTDEQAELPDTTAGLRTTDSLHGDGGETRDTDAEEDEFHWERTTVTNPPQTVSVTALMDGKIQKVELSAAVASMTESELAEEILIVADVASQRASSVLHTLLLESMKAQGLGGDGPLADIFGSRSLDLRPPEQAVKAEAEAFATRYTSHDADAQATQSSIHAAGS